MEASELEAMQQRVAKQLQSRNIQYAPLSSTSFYGPYHEAAAVLATFDSTTLRPVPGSTEEPSIEDVLVDSTVVTDTQKQSRWALLPEVRKEVLRQMRDRETMQRALAANLQRFNDNTQEMLDAYIRGDALPLEKQDITQLAGTFQVSEWLGDILDGIPSHEQIRLQFEILALLQSFEQIAGAHFRGRHKELQVLRDYVGVLPPGSFSGHISRVAAAILNWHEKPPLVIYGPGGRGKSALVSRFILDHATPPRTEKFPWAYIDFDRPAILPEDPLTIMIEAVRQLGIQYPNARKFCDRLYANWQEQLVKQTSHTRKEVSQQRREAQTRVIARRRDWEPILADFGNLLRNLKVESEPFLLVLDTFETAQYRSSVIVVAMFEFLQLFQTIVPRLRTVIAGRAPITEMPDLKVQLLELGNFDPKAAQGFLQANHVPVSLSRTIAKQVGGNPLSLKLALDLWEIWNKERSSVDPLEMFRFRKKLAENEIQGVLFTRILERINDGDVRKLAYPGLVLRRVTAELIRQVLAEPCGVQVKDDASAKRLFDEMRREVSLVTYEDGALRHRDDVRQVMVHLMRQKDREGKIKRIEESVVAYYERQEGPIARAEEIYHRLSLKQPVSVLDSRWIENFGLEPYLFGALEELAIPEKAWLAPRLGRSLSTAERAQADLLSWELDTTQRVRDLLAHGQPDKALTAIDERPEWTPGSPLYRLKSEALERKGEWRQASDVIVKGIESASQAGNRQLATDLRIRGAAVNLELGKTDAARQLLAEAESLVEGEGEDPLRLIALKLTRLDLNRVVGYSSDETSKMKNELLDIFNKVPDEQVTTEPVLMRRLAYYLANDHVDLLRRIVRLNGLGTRLQGSLRQLARELAAWDNQISAQAKEPPGLLARQAGFEPKGSLTESWTQFVLQADPQSLGRAVANLLQPNVSSSLISATMNVVLEGIIEQTTVNVEQNVGTVVGGTVVGIKIGDITGGSYVVNQTVDPVSAGGNIIGAQLDDIGGSESTAVYGAESLSRLSGAQRRQFMEALLDAFPTRLDLAMMLKFRLENNLESIALTDDLRSTVYRVIEYFERIGATAQLLTAARESNPGNARLFEFATQFGLASTAPNEAKLEKVIRQSSLIDPSEWRSRLGKLEPRVCRVELTAADTNMYGTGFLAGPDLLLTAYHVVEPLVQGKVKPENVSFRFDYKALKGGTTLNPGTVFRLASDWLIDFSPYSSIGLEGKDLDLSALDELDYALLRLEGAPGAEPIGGERAEVSAAVRGWIAAASTPVKIVQRSPILILHHPQAGPIKVSIESEGIIGLNSNGTRIRYRISTEPGSGGAPCFDKDWNLIAIHQGSVPGGQLKSDAIQFGTPVTAILQLLDIRGKRNLLSEKFV